MAFVYCESCDEKFQKFQYDAYAVGDRMLEGVMITVTIPEDKDVDDITEDDIEVEWPDDSYTKQINKDHFQDRIVEYALKKLNDVVDCPQKDSPQHSSRWDACVHNDMNDVYESLEWHQDADHCDFVNEDPEEYSQYFGNG
jgi:hypothetical protein